MWNCERRIGAFEAYATPQKVSAEVTGLKATVANTATRVKQHFVGKLSAGASPVVLTCHQHLWLKHHSAKQ